MSACNAPRIERSPPSDGTPPGFHSIDDQNAAARAALSAADTSAEGPSEAVLAPSSKTWMARSRVREASAVELMSACRACTSSARHSCMMAG